MGFINVAWKSSKWRLTPNEVDEHLQGGPGRRCVALGLGERRAKARTNRGLNYRFGPYEHLSGTCRCSKVSSISIFGACTDRCCSASCAEAQRETRGDLQDSTLSPRVKRVGRGSIVKEASKKWSSEDVPLNPP
jgi:hypothetical protein